MGTRGSAEERAYLPTSPFELRFALPQKRFLRIQQLMVGPVLRASPDWMRSRSRPESLIAVFPEVAEMEPLGDGPAGVVPLKSRRWWSRNKVAWAVTLCVLFGVLVWVGGGGLDIQPSSSSTRDDFPGGTGSTGVTGATREKESQTSPRPPPWNSGEVDDQAEAFKGELGAVLKRSAATKGLNDAEIEEARLVATNAVKEALRRPGGLPPPSPDAVLSSACSLRVEGLPLYNSGGQRCCKVDQMTSGMNVGAQGRRELEEEGDSREQNAGGGAGGEGEGEQLPGVLRTQRTGAAEGQQVVCFPSFIIAGTQKSGTTALTGILEKHPQVMMAGRKELHFFDNKTPMQQTAEIYASNFARFNASQAMEHRAPFVVGEATPFYLASRSACENMRKLVPDVRLVVLVREPVKRAYSEHQMKVRRVEEQGEMLELAPLHAKQIYDCAVKTFPSPDAQNLSEREIELLLEPPSVATAIGECSGEVGEHGKWTDLMIPFIRRIKTKLLSKKDMAAGRTGEKMGKGPSVALEMLREDFSRCFPLKAVAEEMEQRFPGGSWRQRWNRGAPTPPKGGGRKVPGPQAGGGGAFIPVGGAATRERIEQLRGGPHFRNLQYDQQRSWLAHDLDGDSAEHYWNMSTHAGGSAIRGDPMADEDFLGTYRYYGFPDGEGWESLLGDGSKGETRAGAEYGYGPSIAGGYGAEGGEAFLSGGAGFGVDGDAVDSDRRLMKTGALSPVGPWDEIWGAWGTDGERIFDDSCYQRMEKVTPVERVMRSEMKKLRTCFDEALRDLGGLDGLGDAPSVASAAAIDDRLGKCFAVTPGISDQYVYRSLYGVQAYHCLKHMPRDQVMFIESDELRDKPEEVMPRVHQHIGVPDHQYPSLDQKAIMAELEKKYPDFEKRTGWRLDSEYKAEMPEDLAKEIGDFVAPHMKMFARLTGQTFGDWAVDDRNNQEAMAGGTERPQEMFEEEFQRETVRLAQVKSGQRLNRIREATQATESNGGPELDATAAATDKVEAGRDHIP